MQDTDAGRFTEAATSDGALNLARKSDVILLKLALVEGTARFHIIFTGNRM
jgi:hypothetical protein